MTFNLAVSGIRINIQTCLNERITQELDQETDVSFNDNNNTNVFYSAYSTKL